MVRVSVCVCACCVVSLQFPGVCGVSGLVGCVVVRACVKLVCVLDVFSWLVCVVSLFGVTGLFGAVLFGVVGAFL